MPAITKEDLEFSVGSKAGVWEVKEPLVQVIHSRQCDLIRTNSRRAASTSRTTRPRRIGAVAARWWAGMAATRTTITTLAPPSSTSSSTPRAGTATSMAHTTRGGLSLMELCDDLYRRYLTTDYAEVYPFDFRRVLIDESDMCFEFTYCVTTSSHTDHAEFSTVPLFFSLPTHVGIASKRKNKRDRHANANPTQTSTLYLGMPHRPRTPRHDLNR
jgi:hypothetical protein